MSTTLTRKEFFKEGTKYAAGVALGVGAINALSQPNVLAQSGSATWPWTYQKLDPEQVRILGHTAYWSGKGCSYGAFHGLVQALRDKVGEPYNSMPTELMIYGHGGAVGWGTLCGALNGAAGLISLVCLKARSDVLNNELLGWYTQTEFPTDTSNQYAAEGKFTVHNFDGALAQNDCGSVLCHASVTEWCKHSGFVVSDTERKERCARLTGDVAAYAAQILNDELESKFAPLYVPPPEIAGCNTCHTSGTNNKVASKMNCTPCHETAHKVSSVELLGSAAISYELLQNFPNPFNPSTNIQFSLPKAGPLSLTIYDVHGRLVRTLIDDQDFAAGSYKIQWDGKDSNNERVASGMYFSRIRAGEFSAVRKMVLTK